MAKEPNVGDDAVRKSEADPGPDANPSPPPNAEDVPAPDEQTAPAEQLPPNTETAPSESGVEADPNAEVAPTGTANLAGTPQSQLDQAPPMVDPSGSNVPAPNLRQPLADDATASAGAQTAFAAGLDPMLVDPDKAAVQRVEGRTSDAANRSADGPHIDEVPPDITDGVKPSDGGPERYPFPQGGDVDVASIPTDANEGEYYPNLEIEDQVILGEHELIPERLVGRRALVVDAPRYLVPLDKKDEVWITVITRDEVNARLSIPLAAVKDVVKGGAAVTVRG